MGARYALKLGLIALALGLGLWVTLPEAQTTRFVYLTPVDGAGTDTNPYRSRCLGMIGSGNIDLRPWGINRFLCASDVLPSDTTGVIQLGSSLSESMLAARKTALVNLLGKSVQASTVQGAIVEILQNRLRPGRDGKLKIWLGGKVPIYQQTAGLPFPDGGLFADVAMGITRTANLIEHVTIGSTLAWAASIAEDWNCSNSGNPDCDLNWTEYNLTNWDIVSNELSATVNNNGTEARAETTLDTDDHSATFTITSFTIGTSTDSHCGPIIRKDNSSTRTYYVFYARLTTGGDTSTHALGKREAGVHTTLATDGTDYADDETVTTVAEGDQISGKRNGSTLISPVTDASITTNTYTGVRLGTSGGSSTCTIDDFSAQDEVSSNGMLRRRL